MLYLWLVAACLALTTSCEQSIMPRVSQASTSTGVHAGEGQTSEQAKPADLFLESIGANVHLNYFDTGYGNFEVIKKRLLDLGVRHLRDGAQLTNDSNYNNIFYGRLKELASSGIRFDLIFDPRSSMGPLTPEKLSAVAALAGDSLETIEGPNEYDNSQDRNWAYTLRGYQARLYQTAKSDPATRSLAVIGPSFVHAQSRDAIGDLSPYMDYGNLHSYPGGRMPTSNLKDGDESEIVEARKVSGSRPLVSTETGYHTAVASHGRDPGISDRAFAKYVSRLYLEYFNHGFTRTYLYEISDEKPDPARIDPEHNFGLLTSAGEPNPAYFSLRNLIAILGEAHGPTGSRDANSESKFLPGQLRYQLQGETSEIHHTLLQKRDGRFYVILWHETSSYDITRKADSSPPAVRLFLQLDQVRKVNTYLPLESPRAVEHYVSRSIAVDVPDHVLIVEIMP
jgi:hypothetical protein